MVRGQRRAARSRSSTASLRTATHAQLQLETLVGAQREPRLVRAAGGAAAADHDTIAAFRRANRATFEAAFLQRLLLARESGLLRLGMVAIDGTKLDADASKIRSVRYDRAKELRARLAADLARREALKARLDAARTLTNDIQRCAIDVALCYKARWDIDLFFKWIKRNLGIRTFPGRSENAIRLQLLAAMIACLLLSLARQLARPSLSLKRFVELVALFLHIRRNLHNVEMPSPINLSRHYVPPNQTQIAFA